jgi:hypothetical protein
MDKQLAARPSQQHHHHVVGPTPAAKIFSAFFYGASSLGACTHTARQTVQSADAPASGTDSGGKAALEID